MYKTTVTDNTQITALEDLYLNWLAFIDAAPKTVDTYTRAVKQFLAYLKDNRITQPTKEDLINYKTQLASTNHKPATITAYIMAIKQFFKWLEEKGFYPDIAKNVKGARISTEHKKDALTAKQARKLLQSIDTSTVKGLRDYAIILLTITGGLRTVEVSRADIKDIRAAGEHTALYIQGKGHTEKDEPVIIPEETQEALRAYLKERGATTKEPLFTSTANRNAGQRLTTNSISRIIKGHLEAAGLISDRLSAHSLRHTAITQAIKGGANLQEVQQFARHTNINTTLIYAHNLEKENNPCSSLIAAAILEQDTQETQHTHITQHKQITQGEK